MAPRSSRHAQFLLDTPNSWYLGAKFLYEHVCPSLILTHNLTFSHSHGITFFGGALWFITKICVLYFAHLLILQLFPKCRRLILTNCYCVEFKTFSLFFCPSVFLSVYTFICVYMSVYFLCRGFALLVLRIYFSTLQLFLRTTVSLRVWVSICRKSC